MSLLGHSLLVLPVVEMSSQWSTNRLVSSFTCENYSITERKLIYTNESKNSQFQASDTGLDNKHPKDYYAYVRPSFKKDPVKFPVCLWCPPSIHLSSVPRIRANVTDFGTLKELASSLITQGPYSHIPGRIWQHWVPRSAMEQKFGSATVCSHRRALSSIYLLLAFCEVQMLSSTLIPDLSCNVKSRLPKRSNWLFAVPIISNSVLLPHLLSSLWG